MAAERPTVAASEAVVPTQQTELVAAPADSAKRFASEIVVVLKKTAACLETAQLLAHVLAVARPDVMQSVLEGSVQPAVSDVVIEVVAVLPAVLGCSPSEVVWEPQHLVCGT